MLLGEGLGIPGAMSDQGYFFVVVVVAAGDHFLLWRSQI